MTIIETLSPRTGLSETDQRILEAALRAPSAHNAQPWRLVARAATRTIELHYDHREYLPEDPDDRDAYLCMGALIETLVLAAYREGVGAQVSDVYTREGDDLFVATITLTDEAERSDELDWLAAAVADRHTNRSAYTRDALPRELQTRIETYGGHLVDPGELADTVARASRLSWSDPRFVSDLQRFCMSDEDARVGMTRRGLLIARYEWVLLQGAFALGRLPGWLGAVFASRDVRLLRTAPAVVVLGADTLEPRELVSAGRRLLRIWVSICGTGWAYHPISVSVDRRETAGEVAALSGVRVPAAVFRVGRARTDAPRSARAHFEERVRVE